MRVSPSRQPLASHLFFVASGSRTSGFVGRGRMQDGIHEDLASMVMQREELELLDGVRGRLLRTGHNEFCHRKSAQGRCARYQSFLLGRNASLKTRFFSRSSNNACSMSHGVSLPPSRSVRQIAGSVKSKCTANGRTCSTGKARKNLLLIM